MDEWKIPADSTRVANRINVMEALIYCIAKQVTNLAPRSFLANLLKICMFSREKREPGESTEKGSGRREGG